MTRYAKRKLKYSQNGNFNLLKRNEGYIIVSKHTHTLIFSKYIYYASKFQASTLTFVWLSGISENWRRTSRSCITIVRRDKWKNPQTCRYAGQIYFHLHKILGLLYKRALFDLQFDHNLFWLKLKWNARSKLFYCVSFIVPPCFDEVQGHWQN